MIKLLAQNIYPCIAVVEDQLFSAFVNLTGNFLFVSFISDFALFKTFGLKDSLTSGWLRNIHFTSFLLIWKNTRYESIPKIYIYIFFLFLFLCLGKVGDVCILITAQQTKHWPISPLFYKVVACLHITQTQSNFSIKFNIDFKSNIDSSFSSV